MLHFNNPSPSPSPTFLLIRALEASLRENNVNMSKPMLALFQDPKNPHKRKRIGQTPVGLKNIGNTCWFSAVIQVGVVEVWSCQPSSGLWLLLDSAH